MPCAVVDGPRRFSANLLNRGSFTEQGGSCTFAILAARSCIAYSKLLLKSNFHTDGHTFPNMIAGYQDVQSFDGCYYCAFQ